MPEAGVATATPAAPAPTPRQFTLPVDLDSQETPPGGSVEKPVAAPAAPAVAGGGTPAKDNGDQATSAASDGEQPKPAVPEAPEAVTPEQAAKREGRRFERRLGKAYREAAEAKARADLLEKQINELNQRIAPKPPVTAGEPTLEQFGFDTEKYASAVKEFAKQQAIREYEATRQTEAQRQVVSRVSADWEAKSEKATDKYDDYEAVVGDMKPVNPLTQAIMTAENGPEIAYFLGKNLKEAQRIVALDPISQVREIGRLEAKLLAEPVKPKTPSKAPAPITPLSGAASPASDTLNDPDLDYETWLKRRYKSLGRK